MTNFVLAPEPEYVEGLGRLLGTYKNVDGEHGPVLICENGVAWWTQQHLNKIAYMQITNVDLPDRKESTDLILETAAATFRLPITGRRGQFVDSLAMWRFFDRVVTDVHANGSR
jgi:hypothetical protein